jgi:site-specific DNA recombinase
MNYLIARVSDKEQRKALPAQRKRLYDYAAKKSWVQDKHFTYIEYDETAFKEDRRKFQELVIEPLRAEKELAVVVFDKIDRFSRDSSSEERAALTKLFRQGRIEMHFPSDNLFIHKDSPAPDLFRLDIGVALAGYYSGAIRDNVKRRFEQMLNDGIWVGYAPIGYTNVNLGTADKPVKDIHIDEARAKHIVTMFEKRATGMPYELIANYVNAQGLTSKSGKKLNKSAVEKILRNPFYYGKMTYMGKLYPHKYEPLISKKLFDACQEMRDKRHDVHATYNSMHFTFKEIVKCKVCGCTVSSFKARDNTYLKCSGAKGRCGNLNTAKALVMPDVVKTIAAIPMPPEVLEHVIGELKSRHDNQQQYFTQNIEQTRKEYDKIKERLKALTYERLDGRITTELYDEIVEELSGRQQELNNRLVALTDSNKSFLITASYLLDLAQRAHELFQNASDRLQQKMLKFVLSNIELFDKQLTYVVNDPYKTFIEINKKAQSGPSSANWCG